MRIEQLDWRNEDLLELLRDDNVYFVRVNFRNVKNSTDVLPHPWGMSFNRLNSAKFKEVIPLLDSKEATIVRVITEMD